MRDSCLEETKVRSVGGGKQSVLLSLKHSPLNYQPKESPRFVTIAKQDHDRAGAQTGMEIDSKDKEIELKDAFEARSTSQYNKVISLVPDHDPWQSPSLNYSRNVALTSNYDDYDPEKIKMKLARNRLIHKKFDESLVLTSNRHAMQEILDKQIPRSDPRYVNVALQFKEKAPSVIEKMKMQ